ncbi:MFS transporter [Corynebacterium sp. 3HC-13]|nr:MFS transporter [Corynebacterium poyangense]
MLLLATVLPLIDSSVVNVLLPAIGHALGVAEADAQLGVSGYMLAATAWIVLSTSLVRRFGSTQVLMVTMILFGVASLVVGLSPNLVVFILSRVVQGAASGFIMPVVQAVAADIVGKEGMRAALATIGLPAVIAPAFGPLLGGALVHLVGWRTLFLINIPLVVGALLLAPKALAKSTPHILPLGAGQAVPAILGMVGLLWGISSIGGYPSSTVLLIFALALICIAIFAVLDWRAKTPLLDVSVYRQLSFSTVILLCFMVGAVFYGTLLSTSMHTQLELGQPAWVAGLVLAAQGAGAWITRSVIKGPWKSADPFLILGGGLILAAISSLAMQLINHWSMTAALLMLGCAVFRGLGLGGCTLMALSAGYEVLSAEKSATVAAHTRLALQCGGGLGAAVVGIWPGSSWSLGAATCGFSLLGAVFAFSLLLRQSRTPVVA